LNGVYLVEKLYCVNGTMFCCEKKYETAERTKKNGGTKKKVQRFLIFIILGSRTMHYRYLCSI
jgi:hypothetical protein